MTDLRRMLVRGLTVGSTGIEGDRSGWDGGRDALALSHGRPYAGGRRRSAIRLLQASAQRADLQQGLQFSGPATSPGG